MLQSTNLTMRNREVRKMTKEIIGIGKRLHFCQVSTVFLSFLLIWQASFFIAYVVTSGWTNTASELLRLKPFLLSFFKKRFCKASNEDFEVPSMPYHREIPRLLLFGLVGVIYFFLAPLILPFIVLYFCLGYVIYRHQVGTYMLLLDS